MHKFAARGARPSARTSITLLAAAGLIEATAAIAPAMTASHTSIGIRPVADAAAADAAAAYNGIVNNNGKGVTVYDYPGGGTALDTSLPATASLGDGTQVHIQCYLTGTSVTGPNGLASGGTDAYWDQITGASAGLAVAIPAGHALVVPDAYIQTSSPVDQLVPACGSGSSPASPPAAGSGAPSSPATPLPYAPGACRDVDVVFARGTGEQQGDNQGLASVGKPFVDVLARDLPGKTVMYYGVNFTADYAQVSTLAGADDMENHVKTVAAQCPNTTFVLGGYSQGAAVADVTIGLGPVLGPVYVKAGLALAAILGPLAAPGAITGGSTLATLIATHPGLPDSLAGRIAAVVTWGNPIHWANQSIATASPVYGPKSDDFCNPGDPVCANGVASITDPLATHRQYATDGKAQQGAQFAADKVTAAG